MSKLQPGTRVLHLGHTTFLVENSEFRLLVDPVLVTHDFRTPGFPQWYLEDSLNADAIFISHGHDDHFHPPTLLGLRQETPVYFFDEDPQTCSCCELPTRRLANLGLRSTIPVKEGDIVTLADGGLRVHVIPAEASFEGEEQCCLLIETPDALILDAVDIRDSPTTRAALEPFCGKVDLAFLPTGASVQWQGFWNQMDPIGATAFARWLRPAAVAPCGGALSWGAPPTIGSVERYPTDLADWLLVSADRLDGAGVICERPPFQVLLKEHSIRFTGPVLQSRPPSWADTVARPSATLAMFFTGYSSVMPVARIVWPHVPLGEWLRSLQPLRDAVSTAHRQMSRLLLRCGSGGNCTPAGLLVPHVLRCLLDNDAVSLAAEICTRIPDVTSDPGDLDRSFFSVIESLIVETIDERQLHDLRTCLWIDRNLFFLTNVHIRLRNEHPLDEATASEQREKLHTVLRGSLFERRPVLGPHHFRILLPQAGLSIDTSIRRPDTVELLYFANRDGVHTISLGPVETILLDACDGRPLRDVARLIVDTFDIDMEEANEAISELLLSLTRASVLLVDWSR